MSVTTASYVARRAAQKERVRILYRRALKDTLNWAVHRHLFYHDADALREKFEANRQVEDIELIDKMIAAGEASHDKWRHPDPYIGNISACFRDHIIQYNVNELGLYLRIEYLAIRK
ncbi:NADH dehydrogenase [ubiquinone] 1 beta subcomplex subunit 9-like isoform X3 [Salvia miltiorrhiza]|uniref:NADH dehydrogenase [ubiquinone] 1 beta subcomplex subunit 9-like isoform X3 n=1 Tax=Salvia miltiorrhiza TaxID=226208 RepID=UPI0025ACECEB|nr:NADH dehydrogenase [ubiquinone] 1 beta subcomplex subunit 9-like isoform X3 [Salvia miltiorrhiza]